MLTLKMFAIGAGSHGVPGKVGLKLDEYNTKDAVQIIFETEKGKKMYIIYQICEIT